MRNNDKNTPLCVSALPCKSHLAVIWVELKCSYMSMKIKYLSYKSNATPALAMPNGNGSIFDGYL